MFATRQRDRHGEAQVERLVTVWTRACEGADLVRQVDTVTGPTVIAPKITDVTLGPPTVLIVELQPGMIPADVTDRAHRIAPHLGVYGLRVEPMALGRYVRVTLLDADPLDRTVGLGAPARSALRPLLLGRGEDGRRVTLDLAASTHLIVQGTTGSGKSVLAYALLAQLARAADVLVTGTDVSGLLLAPWAEHPRHAGHQVLGTGNPEAHVTLLEDRVAAMDKAIAGIPRGRDSVGLGADCPVTLVVIEEFAGLLRLLDSTDKKLGARARTALARLLAEGRKAGVRVVILVQRADAAIIGAYERGQASHRISLRVDTRVAVDMLHPGVTPDVADQHATAAAGVGLLTAPGMALTRFRGPFLSYAGYCDTVENAG